jgi:hypothetical protein
LSKSLQDRAGLFGRGQKIDIAQDLAVSPEASCGAASDHIIVCAQPIEQGLSDRQRFPKQVA